MNVAPALSHLLAGVGTPKSRPRTRSGGRERVRRAHDVADFRADAPHQIKPGSIKPFPHPSRHHQRGAMAITIAIMLLGLIFMLGLVEIGYLYWAKRDTQKVADLAALSGAQRLPDCANATGAAHGNAVDDNGFVNPEGLSIDCGRWDPSIENDEHYSTPADEGDPNAVRVRAERPAAPIFGLSDAFPAVGATAIARQSEPVAAFSVGSQLLELQNDGLVPGLLKVVGLDVGGTTLVGYNGLANVRITPAGLLEELGIDVTAIADVGTLNSILAANEISVGQLFDAVIHLGQQQGLADGDVQALNAIRAQLIAQSLGPIQLGSLSDSNRGLFALIETANARSALDVELDALNLLIVGLEVANSRHFVDLSVPIPGVSAWVTVIEPPSIAIGGVGATAYTAQVRVRVNVGTSAIPALGGLLEALGTQINLPIILDVITGHGELTELCDTADRTATIHTETSILNMCVGKFDDGVIGSTSHRCDYNLQSEDLVKLLGITLVRGQMFIPALQGADDLVLEKAETGSVHADLDLGDTVAGLVQQLLGLLLNGATGSGGTPPNVSTMANTLWNEAGAFPDTPSGRGDRMEQILGSLTPPDLEETIGLLPGLLDLVEGLLGSIENLLSGILGAITGDGCTTTLLGLPGGSVSGCKSILRDTLSDTHAGVPNSIIAPLLQILDLLRPVLNGVGENLLQPLLEDLLGESPGRADVYLQSLQCDAAQLVY